MDEKGHYCIPCGKDWDDCKCATVSKSASVGVMHPCQRTAGIIHKRDCRSKKETKAYKVMADREAYTLVNIKVYLCPKCAKEMGV